MHHRVPIRYAKLATEQQAQRTKSAAASAAAGWRAAAYTLAPSALPSSLTDRVHIIDLLDCCFIACVLCSLSLVDGWLVIGCKSPIEAASACIT